jgi:hypothetical protein
MRHVNCHLSSTQSADLAKLENLKAQYERYESCGLLEPLPPISIPPGSVDPLFLEAPVSQPTPGAGQPKAVPGFPEVAGGPGFLDGAMGQRREVSGFPDIAVGQRREGPGFLEVAMGRRFQGPGFLEVAMGQCDVVTVQPGPTSGDVEMTPVQAVLPRVDDQCGVVRFQAASLPVVDQRNVQRFLAASNASVVINPRPRRNASAPKDRADKPESRGKQAKKKVQVTVGPLVNHPSADKSQRVKTVDLPLIARRFKTPEYLAKEKAAAQAVERRSNAKAVMSTPAMVPQVIGLFDIIRVSIL